MLLHQEVLAGVGNVFKSEICFVCGVHPLRGVRRTGAKKMEAVVGDGAQTDQGQCDNRLGGHDCDLWRAVAADHARHGPEETCGYGRLGEPCRRCGAPVEMRKQGPRRA